MPAPIVAPRASLLSGATAALVNWNQNTFAALSVRNFRIFFLGQGFSLTGSWMRRTALGWLVFELTGSYGLLGLVTGLATLPLAVLAPYAGAVADRVDKRRMIIWSQVVACVVSAEIAVLTFFHLIEIWQLMLLSTLGGVAFAFEVPARQALVVELVGKRNLMNAIALNSALVNLTRILGPVSAGLLLATVGTAWCFAVDAFTYILVAWSMMVLRLPPFKAPVLHINRLEHLIGGFREVLHNGPVGLVMLQLFFTTTFGWSFITLLAAVAQDAIPMSEAQYGTLMAFFGSGALVAALYVAGQKSTTRARRRLFSGVWIMMAGLYLFSLARTYPLLSVALIITGFGAILFISTGNTVVQTHVPDELRGRIMGVWSLTFGGAMPFGSYLIGLLAGQTSPFTATAAFASVSTLASIVIFLKYPARLPDPISGEEAAAADVSVIAPTISPKPDLTR